VLEVLFERVTEAYLTLERPRSPEALRTASKPSWQVEAPAVSRPEEAQRLYERARSYAAAEQFHAAIELLREACAPRQGRLLALLGLLESRNPLWLHHAEEHLRRAIGQGAKDPSLPARPRRGPPRIGSGDTAGATRRPATRTSRII